MKKIIISLSIIGAAAAIAIGATTSFFSDTETSTGNTFTAGAIDLGIDNHSYYNGVLNPGTTWRVDYNIEDDPPRQFFNFTDLKPGDWGEDTISLHVNNNDAWLCADVTLTSNDDKGINEPEAEDGDATDGVGAGELADHIIFYWWADDGDNVFETDETLLPAGSLGNLLIGQTVIVTLADSLKNIWNPGQAGGPFPGDEVKFLAKAWCFGDATVTPYTQDGGNKGSGPDDRPLICDGANENNITQTDSLTMDISFRALQARHNENFRCQPNGTPTPSPTPSTTPSPSPSPTLTVNKVLDPSQDPGLFNLQIDGSTAGTGADVGNGGTTGAQVVSAGAHTVGETAGTGTNLADYISVIGGDPDCADGNVSFALGENKTCTITNTRKGTITVIKEMQNDDGGNNVIGDFQLFVGGTSVVSGASNSFAAGSYVVSETGVSGYAASFSGNCDQDGNVTLGAGENKTCTLTNDDIKPNITLIKSVTNNNGGTAQPGDFAMRIDGALVPSGTSKLVTANAAHTITEDAKTDYSFVNITGSPQCPAVLGGTATLSEGQAITCTITNDDN